jgi:hypothetical protein
LTGNHEHETPSATGYFGYWGERAGVGRKGYHSIDLGGWHLVALDSSIAGAAQARWLAADLAGGRARCKLAFFHHPLFSSGMHGGTPGYAQVWCTGSGGGLVLGSLHGLAVTEADTLDELTEALRAVEAAPVPLG